MNNKEWNFIFEKENILKHNFSKSYYMINIKTIKKHLYNLYSNDEKKINVLYRNNVREKRPDIFIENNLFILPIKNGVYAILKGEGYIDIPEISSKTEIYESKLDFELVTSSIGNSEMQYLDFAYASSLIRTFMDDESLFLTIRGRKYSPEEPFSFFVGNNEISVKSVQTEVDAGYEGKDNLVLIEAKNSSTKNTIIRQLYYPFKQWSRYTNKKIHTLFFEKRDNIYSIWNFGFKDESNYNSIYLVNSKKFKIK